MPESSPKMFEQIIGAFIALGVVVVCFYILVRTYWIWHLNHMRRQGFDLTGRKPTLFDVRELLKRGEKDLAVRIYRQVFKVDQKDAQAAVDALEKSLHGQG